MIRFGPAGIPLSCKGRTLIDGIEDVYGLGLSAMELQLVRMNEIERYPMEEEVGIPLRDVATDLVLQIVRGREGKRQTISDPDEKVKEGDTLVAMLSGPAANFKQLTYARKLAKKLDITLSLHSPYYMDLTSTGEEGKQSVRMLQWAGIIAKELDAKVIVTHVGLYEGRTPVETYATVKRNLAEVTDWYRQNGIKTDIGIELSGRQEVFGTMEEIIRLCKEVKGIIPIVNVPHVHARGSGSLIQKEDFLELFKKTEKFTGGLHYVHFSGVEHEDGNEIRYTPIKKGDLRFEPMAEALIDNLYDMTVISGSPLLEHDAMYMRVIFERNFARTVSKEAEEAFEDEDEEKPRRPKKAAAPAKGKAIAKQAPEKAKPSKSKPSPGKAAPAKAKPAPKMGKKPAAKPTASKGTAVKGKPPMKKPAAKKVAGKTKPAAKKAKPAAKKPMPRAKPKATKKTVGKAKPAAKKAKPAAKKPAPKAKPKAAKKPAKKAKGRR